MKRLMPWMLTMVLAGVTMLAGAQDHERGTADEAVALVKKAIAYYKQHGRDKVAAEVNLRTPLLREKDLYVFIMPLDEGPVIAHGGNAKLVGKRLYDLRDVDGVGFMQKFRDVANSKDGKGWVDYRWPNTVSGKIEPKSTYVERVGDLYFASGIYKPLR
ncbi:cache domain-containing protein [Massilia sp. YIM B04103]|uniref:cache domain-containing protein n=1 Tax=Massilia sp. YIM B04103 TaxID=2963106 RepID=UPI0021086D80|nr:cache domain-containing protein [Massilia sp. YIM B04103]